MYSFNSSGPQRAIRALAVWLAMAASTAPAATSEVAAPAARTTYGFLGVDGVRVFYRQAGPADAPVVLLLHGFGASSAMFRDLIPMLATRYRVIAPDLPGFGLTEVPVERNYQYSFSTIADTMAAFTEKLDLKRYSLYVFDYGAPTGFRLAMRNPERVTAIISQNGNAYVEGLSKRWSPIQAYWKEPSPENRNALRPFMRVETTKWQYLEGVPDKSKVSPDGWMLAQVAMDRPGNVEIQLDLFGDYKSNVALYPEFQSYLRAKKPPLLAVWGTNDPFFLPAGAEAFNRDNPNAEVHFYDTGHFALETNADDIGREILRFLDRVAAR
jgi:pimeloyl-ACP methyl ester carboxylesterase